MMQKITLFFVIWLLNQSLYAATPYLSIIPEPLNSNQINLYSENTVNASYIVTNNSKKTGIFVLRQQQGISHITGGCSNPILLEPQQSCVLKLQIDGSNLALQNDSGPVICKTMGNGDNTPSTFACKQPRQDHLLRLNVVSGPGHISFSQNGVQTSHLRISPLETGTLTITNTGNHVLTNMALAPHLRIASYFSSHCPKMLNPGESCSIAYSIPETAATGFFSISMIADSFRMKKNSLAVTIEATGGLHCWGLNNRGQLGNASNSGTYNSNTTPLAVQNMNAGVVGMFNHYQHSCAVLNNGEPKCWGWNLYGQLGNTNNIGTHTPNTVPLSVLNLSSGVLATAGGFGHTCALLQTGGVKCWGLNNYGQLGNVSDLGSYTSTPLPVETLSSGVIALSSTYNHACALLDTGAVKCWGQNNTGQLGNAMNAGTNNPNPTPLPVEGLTSGVVAISAGWQHTCALLETGEVKCWGKNQYGQVGNPATVSGGVSYKPLSVLNLPSGVTQISAGDNHTCALLNTGGVKCWGFNYYGQLGDNANVLTGSPNVSPLDVQTLSSGVMTVSAAYRMTCALLNTGAVKCWGLNANGQLGNDTNDRTYVPNTVPLDVNNLSSGVKTINEPISFIHSCVII